MRVKYFKDFHKLKIRAEFTELEMDLMAMMGGPPKYTCAGMYTPILLNGFRFDRLRTNLPLWHSGG